MLYANGIAIVFVIEISELNSLNLSSCHRKSLSLMEMSLCDYNKESDEAHHEHKNVVFLPDGRILKFLDVGNCSRLRSRMHLHHMYVSERPMRFLSHMRPENVKMGVTI